MTQDSPTLLALGRCPRPRTAVGSHWEKTFPAAPEPGGGAIPAKIQPPKTRQKLPNAVLQNASNSSILATQFEPLKPVVKVAPLRRKWVVP